MSDCDHPQSKLEDPSIPSVGDAIAGGKVSVKATCGACEETVIVDATIADVMDYRTGAP